MKKPERATQAGAEHSGAADNAILPLPRRCYPLTDAYGQTTAYICRDPAELIRFDKAAQA